MLMRRGLGIFLFVCLMACWPAKSAAANDARRLRDVLAKESLPLGEGAPANLDKSITSAGNLNEPDEYVIAYYVDEGTNELNAPLYIDRYDKKGGKWQSARILAATAEEEGIDTPCLGSVLGIQRFGEYLLLDTHINPSAGCLLIVDRELKLKGGLYGWFLSGLGRNGILYHRSEIHFAPVHATEIALYDLAASRDATIFPQKPDQTVRAALSKQVREFREAHADWCNEHDDPCDPEWLDSELLGKVAANAERDAVAFVISYERGQLQEKIRKPEGPKEVLYVYRHVSDAAKREYREMLLEEAKKEFQANEVDDFVMAERLKKVFEK
jgi:hypothetical protein